MEGVWFKSGLHRSGLIGELPVVVCLSFCRRDIRLVQAVVRWEPVRPFHGRDFEGLRCFPSCTPVNQRGFAKAVDGFCQHIIVAATGAANGWFDTGFVESLGIAN